VEGEECVFEGPQVILRWPILVENGCLIDRLPSLWISYQLNPSISTEECCVEWSGCSKLIQPADACNLPHRKRDTPDGCKAKQIGHEWREST
jgi:hypothetical protein